MNRKSIWNPFWVAIILAIGVLLGAMLKPKSSQLAFSTDTREEKINEIIRFIENDYVDEVNADELLDNTLTDLLKSLDPHSSYIPASDLSSVKESIDGTFQGIGVEFSIQKDTVMVVAAISGGPSEELGIQSGDRIISVEGESIAGIGIKNSDVVEKLRGEKGTVVNVSIYRPIAKQTLEFKIKRDNIPIYSVDAAFMMDQTTGYIKVSKFTANTYREFRTALQDLNSEGMESLVLDLRGNPGGLLSVCKDMADEFLKKGEMILYTEGQARKRTDFKASSRGIYEDKTLSVLIDEGSASASEIIAGAMQDNDRAIIVGRRSFGKGLVQEPIYMADGSAIHLTTSRYYTPSGRSIQRDYAKGLDSYYEEIYNRFENGENFNADSINFPDSLIFKTSNGRTVYGGGGIMPDKFVPLDTSFYCNFYFNVYSSSFIREFAFGYADKNREDLLGMGMDGFLGLSNEDEIFQEFMSAAKAEDYTATADELKKCEVKLKSDLKALIGRQIWKNEAWFKQQNKTDKVVQAAIEGMKNFQF